jgi:hypothetical protein
MNKYLIIILFLMVFICFPLFQETIIAQPPPPDPEEIPIDSGLSVLLAAGIAYAAKKLYGQRNKDE